MLKAHYDRYLSERYILNVFKESHGEVVEGELLAKTREHRAPIVSGIPRFVPEENYCNNFGLQWNRFCSTQLDSHSGKPLSAERFWSTTRWQIQDLSGKTVLEAGSGAGRFTEILLSVGAEVVSFDYSNAVLANHSNNHGKGDLFLFQGDLFHLPLEDAAFDFVFCHGVLQHTPNPEQAFFSIEKKLRPGGRISVDVYAKDGKIRPWKSKYLWRPLTTRMAPEKLLKFLRWFIPLWLPIDTLIKRIPILGNYLGAVIPCWNYFYLSIPHSEKVEWAIMDTFDALAPRYDLPVTLEEVRSWFQTLGYTEYEVFLGGNGIVGNGLKPM